MMKDFESMRKDLNAWAGGQASSDGKNSWDEYGPHVTSSYRKEMKDKSTMEYLLAMGFDEAVLAPCTTHHAPHTMHHTSCTTHHATANHASRTIHHTPYTTNRLSGRCRSST
jgi:hypothetical protein